MKHIIITTIQAPTSSILALLSAVGNAPIRLIAIGDRKTPVADWPKSSQFVPIADQSKTGLALSQLLPENHYSRKNIGYVLAMQERADAIFDTDDDNAPIQGWHARDLRAEVTVLDSSGWTNAYSLFTDADIWPRGFPLELLRDPRTRKHRIGNAIVDAPIQQGLANGSPDVDAVWRLLQDTSFEFRQASSVLLQPGAWCPFNSQSTWWFPTAYPLLYLPSHVSFRMTDIWRSFIAQRCLWELGLGVVFHGPEMFQDRNPHNLLRDFEQEVPGYLGNARLCSLLEGTPLSKDPGAVGKNLYRCYEQLVAGGFVPSDELVLVQAWLSDVAAARSVVGTTRAGSSHEQ